MVNPWDKHTHEPAKAPDAEGDTLCVHCGLVMAGPSNDELDELRNALNQALAPASRATVTRTKTRRPGQG